MAIGFLRILSKLAKSILYSKLERGEKGHTIKLKRVDATSPHGVYVYDRVGGVWVLRWVGGEGFRPWRDGFYVVYFDNTCCPACRVFDAVWFTFVDLVGRGLGDTEFILVLCEWFSGRCNSPAAASTFRRFNVKTSPTILLLKVVDGRVVGREEVKGVKPLDTLIEKLNNFRAGKA